MGTDSDTTLPDTDTEHEPYITGCPHGPTCYCRDSYWGGPGAPASKRRAGESSAQHYFRSQSAKSVSFTGPTRDRHVLAERWFASDMTTPCPVFVSRLLGLPESQVLSLDDFAAYRHAYDNRLCLGPMSTVREAWNRMRPVGYSGQPYGAYIVAYVGGLAELVGRRYIGHSHRVISRLRYHTSQVARLLVKLALGLELEPARTAVSGSVSGATVDMALHGVESYVGEVILLPSSHRTPRHLLGLEQWLFCTFKPSLIDNKVANRPSGGDTEARRRMGERLSLPVYVYMGETLVHSFKSITACGLALDRTVN